MDNEIKSFRDLNVWQEAMNMVSIIYKLTQSFPKDELYGLTSQIRRAAVSIPSNIAEGQQRSGTKEFIQFLTIARGSLAEIETQLLIAENLNYVESVTIKEIIEQINKTGKMLGALIKALKNKL